MKLFTFLTLLLFKVVCFGQTREIYIPEFKKSFELIEFKIHKNDTINRIVKTNHGRELKLGHWVFFYQNGLKKAEGFYKIKKEDIDCGRPHPDFYDFRADNWLFWDNNGNQTNNIYLPERPGTGYYKLHSKDSLLIRDGYFKNEEFISGTRFEYDKETRELIKTSKTK